MIHTCTSSVASPKFNLELDIFNREARFVFGVLEEPRRLGRLPLLLVSSSGVPGLLSNCSRLKK